MVVRSGVTEAQVALPLSRTTVESFFPAAVNVVNLQGGTNRILCLQEVRTLSAAARQDATAE